MPRKRGRIQSNPIDWAKHAHWFEAEGTKVRPPIKKGEYFLYLATVTQSPERGDIVDKLCEELKSAGFTPLKRERKHPKGTLRVCELRRIEEQYCFIERTKPYYISERTKQWAEAYQ